MPIANCAVSKNLEEKVSTNEDLIDIWSKEAGTESNEMTISIAYCDEVKGKQYDVISHLYLPSIWSEEKRRKIEIGLAIALSRYFQIPINNVIVILSIVQSGQVVENGKVIEW